ncbi:MAG: phosphatase PAP2 family protein [Candidatus Jordarchaeum sp.]|uniref:phosphatase PAP2 family protein n=1 Tax=Candidatus Jordarchaeum sp. TaxID=2823881 RepID=UPI0040498806
MEQYLILLLISLNYCYVWDLGILWAVQGSFWTPLGFLGGLPLLDLFWRAVTFLGDEILLFVLVAIIYWLGYKREGVFLALLLIFSTLINYSLKYIIGRFRPTFFEARKVYFPEGPSMPSGHAQTTTATAFTLAWLAKGESPLLSKRGILLFLLAAVISILVSISRVYLGAHWPTDVISGLLIGLLIFGVFVLLADRTWKLLDAKLPESPWIRVAIVIVVFLILALVLPFNWEVGWYLNILLAGYITGTFPITFLTIYPFDWGMSWYLTGAIAGFLSGAILEQKYIQFSIPASWKYAVLRIIIGIVVALPGYYLIDKIPWGPLQFPVYAVLGLWVTLIAPAIFKKLEPKS